MSRRDVCQQLGALIDEEATPTQEIARVALGPWINVGHRKRGQIGFEDGVAIVVEDVSEHASCVEIDAGVECVGMVEEAHG